ncbi:MAG: hypothetical protein V3T83_20075 [Acidobacteriota bacterium]
MEDKLSVLRECHRVLKPGGRLAGYVIHTAEGLDPSAQSRAADWGPPQVLAAQPPDAMALSAGLLIIAQHDVTEAFQSICQELLTVTEKLQDQLRAELGEALYDEEQVKKQNMLQGIREGLLRRSLIVCAKNPLFKGLRCGLEVGGHSVKPTRKELGNRDQKGISHRDTEARAGNQSLRIRRI